MMNRQFKKSNGPYVQNRLTTLKIKSGCFNMVFKHIPIHEKKNCLACRRRDKGIIIAISAMSSLPTPANAMIPLIMLVCCDLLRSTNLSMPCALSIGPMTWTKSAISIVTFLFKLVL